MRHHPLTTLASVFAVCLLAFGSAALADDTDVAGMVKSVQKQMADLQSTVAMQKAEIQALKANGAQLQTAPGSATATPAMSEAEFNQRLTDSLGGANQWLKDLKFTGDLRLRYEAFHLSNTANNTLKPDYNRFRFRLRFGFEKTFSPEWSAGFSLASGDKQSGGTQINPASENATMGNNFDYKNVWIDRAYATYKPQWAKVGPVSGLEVTAGKFLNPFERGTTDMIWDRNLRPEGIYEKADFNVLQTDNLNLKAYGIAGQFVLDSTDVEASALAYGRNAELWAYQVGLNPTFYVPGLKSPVDMLSALSIYDYSHYAENSNWSYGGLNSATTAGGSVTSGGTVSLDAGQYDVLDFYQDVTVRPYGIPVRPFFEFAHNMADQSYLSGGSVAWSTGVFIGQSKKKGDWQASYQYKWLGESSVPGAFNDSDFGDPNFGGVDKAGSEIKAGYNLTDFLTVNAAAYIMRPITYRGTATYNGGGNYSLDEKVNRFQLDLTWKF